MLDFTMRAAGKFILGVFFSLGLGASLAAGETNAAAPATAAFTDQQIIETWGWVMARNQNVAGIEISNPELAALLQGFAANAKGRPAPQDLQKIYPDVERMMKARREKVVRALEQTNEAAAKVFFAGLKKNPKVLDLTGGTRFEILKPGHGPQPKPQQTVNVHYTGRLIDGTEFAQMGPLDLVLVTNRSVCRGWIEALQKISPGGALKLYVPPPLLEDEAFSRGIEPGSAMVFEIELLGLTDTSAEDLENALLPPAPEPPAPPPSDCPVRQVIEGWGWILAQESGVARFKLSETEVRPLLRGLAAGINGLSAPYDWQKIRPAVEQFVADRREKVRLATRQKRLDEMNALFAGLKQNTNVVELPDGLRYEIVKPGSGPCPKPGQIVLVDYTGRLVDGTVFDKTYNEPLHIEVGSVIPGWNEGIQKINNGGRLKLYIPPEIGYGDENHSGVVAPIPADSTLIYDIELLDIQDAQ
jgi:FKBP-type peptidyl-prolyl cis-trans isomerase